jgi:hypothetical protein
LNRGGTKVIRQCLTIFVGLDSVRDVQAKIAELYSQGLAGDSQQPSGLVLIAAGEFQNSGKQDSVHMSVRFTADEILELPDNLRELIEETNAWVKEQRLLFDQWDDHDMYISRLLQE